MTSPHSLDLQSEYLRAGLFLAMGPRRGVTALCE